MKLFKRQKRQFTKRDLIVYFLTIIISVLLLIVGHKFVGYEMGTEDGGYEDSIISAEVKKIISDDKQNIKINDTDPETGKTVEHNVGTNHTIVFEAEVSGGKTVKAVESINYADAVQLKKVEKGDKILLVKNDDDADYSYTLHEYKRSDTIIVLIIIFALGLLALGGIKGFNTIVSLTLTCLAVFVIFVPSILAGRNIYLWSVLTCLYITAMTLLIIGGWSKKTLAASIGCMSGVAVAGLTMIIANIWLNTTGNWDEHTVYLTSIATTNGNKINLVALVFSGIILGGLGAIMDVSVELASSLREIYEQAEKPTMRKLIRSGFNIGRDIMGTMANTLVLAYIGSSLCVTLLLVAYSDNMLALFNRENIVLNILQAFTGSFGILLTIPLTTVVSAFLYCKVHFKKKEPKLEKIDPLFEGVSDELPDYNKK